MKRFGRVFAMAVLGAATLGVTMGLAPPDNPDNLGKIVTFDVSVTDKDNNPVPGLERDNFRVFEDNVEHAVTQVRVNRKPLAVVILVEFSEPFSYYGTEVVEPATALIDLLQPEDWGALVSFSVRPEIVTDFTHDNRALAADLRGLRIPFYRDAALFDAVYFVLDRMKWMEEKRAILLLSSGLDGMSSRRTFGDALKRAETSGTTIYSVSFAQASRFTTTDPYPDPGANFRREEGESTLAAFAEGSGGLSFTPMFPGQYRRMAEVMSADLRNQYTLSFVSAGTKPADKMRKLRVEVGGIDIDRDGKPDKLRIRHKKGYYASGS
jgi:VWFA-related protein